MEQIKIKISAKVKGKLMVLAHQKGVCSQIKMNFFAQNLREVSAYRKCLLKVKRNNIYY